MQFLTLLGLAALTSAQGYLELKVEKSLVARPPASERLARRQNSGVSPISAPIYQNTNKLEYIINVTVGTPGQTLGVTLDTGSSDLWIPSNEFCRRANKCDLGYFTPSRSSSYEVIGQGGFNITYAAPGDSDAGDWISEKWSLAGSKAVTNQIMGLANAGYDSHGVMGIGYDTNEAAYYGPDNEYERPRTYNSTLDNLVSQGVISRKAYSLYLNSLNETTGSILFGGVNPNQYSGELVALPLQESGSGGEVREFFVNLHQVAFTDAAGATTVLSPDGYAQSVLLDAGTSDTLLDGNIIGKLATGLGALDDGSGLYVVPCSYAKSNATITYTFGDAQGPRVTVPMSQLVGNPDGNLCDLGIGPPIDGSAIMGDTFLRSAYVVFDLDNNMAAIAQAVDGRLGTSSIIAIPSGTMIPGASSTATAPGTQLSGYAATSTPHIATATIRHSTYIAGTPTFNLGAVATSSSGAGTSNAAPAVTGRSQLALIGAGLAVGALAL